MDLKSYSFFWEFGILKMILFLFIVIRVDALVIFLQIYIFY
jgi:hypothetical protein